MAYAEQITLAKPSKSIVARLLDWATRTGKAAPAATDPADQDHAADLDIDVAVDIAAARRFSGYRSAAGASRGSDARLHGIAASIASTLPR